MYYCSKRNFDHSMNTESPPEGSGYTGRDILYREGSAGFFDVQRAADVLLRLGRKPSVAGIREQLGGGSPNTITPLLAKYWQKLGERLVEGPQSLERVPEALARVTELLWRRALEEARERLKVLQKQDHEPGVLEELQEHIGKLSVALAEAKAREGEHLTQLSALSEENRHLRSEQSKHVALLRGTQRLLDSALMQRGNPQTTAIRLRRKNTQPRAKKRKRMPGKGRRTRR